MLWRNINIETPTQIRAPRGSKRSRYTPTRSDGNSSRILSTSFEDHRNESSCDKRSEKKEEGLSSPKNIVKRTIEFKVTEEWIIKIRKEMGKLIKINKSLCELVKIQMTGVKDNLVKDLKGIEEQITEKIKEIIKSASETSLPNRNENEPQNNFISPLQIKNNQQSYQSSPKLTPKELLLKPISLTKCFLDDEPFLVHQKNNTIDKIIDYSPAFKIGEKEAIQYQIDLEVQSLKRYQSTENTPEKFGKNETMKKILNGDSCIDIESTLELITAKKCQNRKKDFPHISETSILKEETRQQEKILSDLHSLPFLNLQSSSNHESNDKSIKTERQMNKIYFPSRRLSESEKKGQGREALESINSCIENMKEILELSKIKD